MKAFPISNETGLNQEGMDLRDYFAAQALTGAQIWDAVINGKNSVLAGDSAKTLSEVAYAIADAMMKAREQ
jgi:hypothetical protein